MSELLRLGTMKLDEAKTLQRVLSENGVNLVLDHNDHTCTRGCAVTVELLVAAHELETVRNIMQAEFQAMTQGLTVDWGRLGEVFDPAKSDAVCPACGTKFSTQLKACPDCGLCF